MNDETPRHTPFCIVLTTLPDAAQADSLARQIVEAGLGACVQVQAIQSYYRWKGETCAEPEWRLCIKTRKAQYPQLEAFIPGPPPLRGPADRDGADRGRFGGLPGVVAAGLAG